MDKDLKNNIEKRIALAEEGQSAILRIVEAAGFEAIDVIMTKLERLEVVENKLKFSAKNLRAVEGVRTAFSRWLNGLKKSVLKKALSVLGDILGLNEEYFAAQFEVSESVRDKARRLAMLRWGYDNGGIVEGSYLAVMFGDGLAARVGELVNRAIASGQTLAQFRDTFRKLFLSKSGYLLRHFNTTTFDMFQRIDRTANLIYADELGLNHAVYSGTIIKTSRPFCVDRVGRVFTRKEIEAWKELDFEGKPAFGYDPFTDCGGYQCRHHLSFVSKELATALKKVKK